MAGASGNGTFAATGGSTTPKLRQSQLPCSGPVPGAAPTTTTTSGWVASNRSTATQQAARRASSDAADPPPIDGTSSGGVGMKAAAFNIRPAPAGPPRG